MHDIPLKLIIVSSGQMVLWLDCVTLCNMNGRRGSGPRARRKPPVLLRSAGLLAAQQALCLQHALVPTSIWLLLHSAHQSLIDVKGRQYPAACICGGCFSSARAPTQSWHNALFASDVCGKQCMLPPKDKLLWAQHPFSMSYSSGLNNACVRQQICLPAGSSHHKRSQPHSSPCLVSK